MAKQGTEYGSWGAAKMGPQSWESATRSDRTMGITVQPERVNGAIKHEIVLRPGVETPVAMRENGHRKNVAAVKMGPRA